MINALAPLIKYTPNVLSALTESLTTRFDSCTFVAPLTVTAATCDGLPLLLRVSTNPSSVVAVLIRLVKRTPLLSRRSRVVVGFSVPVTSQRVQPDDSKLPYSETPGAIWNTFSGAAPLATV